MQSKRSHYPTYKKAKTVLKFHYGPFVKLYIVPCPLAPVGIVHCRSSSDQLRLTIWEDFTVYILVNTVIPLTLWTLSLDSADSSVMSFEHRLSLIVMSLVRYGQFDADVTVCFQSKCELNDEIKNAHIKVVRTAIQGAISVKQELQAMHHYARRWPWRGYTVKILTSDGLSKLLDLHYIVHHRFHKNYYV